MKFRIYYDSTDAGGIVYHTEYIKFCEQARSEIFFKNGIFFENEGYVVTNLNAKFLSSAKLGDIIEKAFYYGKGMGAFRRAFKEEGVSFDYYVRAISIDEKLPWDVIDVGVKKEFLKKEYERALSG